MGLSIPYQGRVLRWDVEGVDFSTPRNYDGPPLTQSTMREALRRRELSAIREDGVENPGDEDGDEPAGLAEDDPPTLDGSNSSGSSSSGSSVSAGVSSRISSGSSGSSSNGDGCSRSRLVSAGVSSDASVASVSAKEVDSCACMSASSSIVGKF